MSRIPGSPFLVVALLVLAACVPIGGTASLTAPGTRTIQVDMTDELRFEPAEFTVRAGEMVQFEVTNIGQTVHEFLIGDEAAQEHFEMEMAEEDGMAHDSDAGVSIEPGETETFEYTFNESGQLLAGCHEPGHYDGGMVARIAVEA